MFTSRNRDAFTLLEVMLAVTVLAVISLGIYRFVETTMTAVRVTAESEREQALTASFMAYLRGRIFALPGTRPGALMGEPHQFNRVPCDELRWITEPGSGLLTRHAAGEWIVTLTLKELKNGEYELGMHRQDIDGKRDTTWLPLLRGVRGLEIRYYEPTRKEWLEKWTNPQARPALIRVKLWRDPFTEAYETVLPVPVMTRPPGGAENYLPGTLWQSTETGRPNVP